ncbi:MAG: ribonuclease D, partial [Deltaproteobacteria bacterium]
MKKPKLINTPGGLDKFIKSVSGEKYIAVDSESNSFFAHRPRVCLIQISSNQSDFIVDPLPLGDLSALGA